MLRPILLCIAVAGFAGPANAQLNPSPNDSQTQGSRYPVQNMNFDMWCQETQHLPADRCDKRLPADDAAFNAYRDKIERYEIPYLQEQDRRMKLSTGILHNDPVDHPDRPSQPQDQSPPTATPPK